MAKRDYYEVLGVARGVDEAELKKAYRRMAMKYHPDRNPDDKGAEEQFKEVQAAYEILNDSKKRAIYDQLGHAGLEGGGGRGGFGFGDASSFGDIFNDVFSDLFGGNGRDRQNRSYRGADLRYILELDLEEAAFGATSEIRIPGVVACDECAGSGAALGSSPKTCPTCQGHGSVRVQQGFFSVQQACPQCHGSGSIITDPCRKCHGEGQVNKEKLLSVNIPAGIDTGDRVRLSGEGQPGRQGGPAGDLYVQVKIRPHKVFHREGNNLICELPVTFPTAALGGEIEVPTLAGKQNLKIPGGTQSGKIFRVRGQGVKSVRGSEIGDLMVKVHVETPVNLTAEQKELLSRLEETLAQGDSKHSPKPSSWLGGVKDFFERMTS